ncbi:MAG TPA: M67 family metallopeptidase [Trichocoleus sp.]
MVLILNPDNLQAIRAHAERTYPEECCGLLVGHCSAVGEEDVREVVNCAAAENAWDSEAAAAVGSLSNTVESETARTKDSRYWIDPRLMLQVQREARDRNLNIIGVYHSHPDHAAVPSECDRSLAWPGYSYIIISVAQGKATDVRSWHLDDQHQFQAEVMRMGAQPPHTSDLSTPILPKR